MRRTSWRIVSLVVVLSLSLLSCDGPSRGTNTQPSAASGFLIVVTASPNVIRGEDPDREGTGGCSTVQVKVSDRTGRLVDGAQVRVTTSLGRFVIADDDDIVSFSAFTTRGLVSAAFCARESSGTAIITANVEDAFATTTVTLL
jgi:hypothetical protein